ncbi:tetraprenyl-beta-curcumene synthase family protein [Gottfriedia sp. NPDC058432]|uniref:tetraprenyl-beta-curcumene synthase family protein n=1 Tax=Gottfriedia sp. NPDC058432 TaxID=3346497 RepID=UPI003660ECB0
MSLPKNPIQLMPKVYKGVFPLVHQELNYWRNFATTIPDPELRKQALMSIDTKTFHCEGGAILALLSEKNLKPVIEFIVAYQTISDYLDNLCDRSTSLDPVDFEALHESMIDAVKCQKSDQMYYRFREEQDDGGYLRALVSKCHSSLNQSKHYEGIKEYLVQLADYYCKLQIHKHVKKEERVPRLTNWFEKYQPELSDLEWYEFSACAGSTLGIFCLVSYSFNEVISEKLFEQVYKSYFPYVQGLHILLDYVIDQKEDEEGGDLNFCSYYPSKDVMLNRIEYFSTKSNQALKDLKDYRFHRMICQGLLGIYLADKKMAGPDEMKRIRRGIVKNGGLTSFFFYGNAKLYFKLKELKASNKRVKESV